MKKVLDFQSFRRMQGNDEQEDWAHNAQEFADQVRNGEVTHGLMIYRDTDGQVHWRIFNEESPTYALGLISRLAFLINFAGTSEE
jgi:hypothetical protein